MTKRKTVITVETHSLTIVRSSNGATRLRCAACEAETQMLSIEQAASLFSVTERAIFRLVESRRVHFHETPAGQLLICAESLRDLLKTPP